MALLPCPSKPFLSGEFKTQPGQIKDCPSEKMFHLLSQLRFLPAKYTVRFLLGKVLNKLSRGLNISDRNYLLGPVAQKLG
jgi:hypothetical protein